VSDTFTSNGEVQHTAVSTNSRTEAPALEVRDLDSGYGTTTILRSLNLTVPAGSVTALLGPNGAGKSTLLKTISGLIRQSAGSIRLDGVEVSRMAPNRRAKLGLCHIPEGRGIFRSLSVQDNLRLYAEPGSEDEAVERCVSAFPILGERLFQTAGTLSGGQQQMLSLARTYARSARLVLVDEASLGLAPIVVDEIFAFLRGITSTGASLLMVDQFVSRALAMASNVYVLTQGEIVFSGTPSELRDGDVFRRYFGDT
jgi:branched-chain amino acid transport system ATP-binding protein